MTRKQAINTLWHAVHDEMGEMLHEDHMLRFATLKTLWTMCFTNDKRTRCYPSMIVSLASTVSDAREYGDAIFRDSDSVEAMQKNKLMTEITEKASRFQG